VSGGGDASDILGSSYRALNGEIRGHPLGMIVGQIYNMRQNVQDCRAFLRFSFNHSLQRWYPLPQPPANFCGLQNEKERWTLTGEG
jgi:hypothetical protein